MGLEYQVKEDINIYAEAEAGIGRTKLEKCKKVQMVKKFQDSHLLMSQASAGVKYKTIN